MIAWGLVAICPVADSLPVPRLIALEASVCQQRRGLDGSKAPPALRPGKGRCRDVVSI